VSCPCGGNTKGGDGCRCDPPFSSPVRLSALYADEEEPPTYFGAAYLANDPYVLAHLVIDGEPVSKARARFTRSGHVYTPGKTIAAEASMADAFREAKPDWTIDATCGYGVVAIFFLGTNQRRDVDNMLKVVLDGLNKVAWKDDSQVTEVTGRKVAAEPRDTARVEVVIYATRPATQGQLTKPCKTCHRPVRVYPSTQAANQYCGSACHPKAADNSKSCIGCGETFNAPRGRAKYCSAECRNRASRVTASCEQCGRPFTLPQSQMRLRRRCGKACQIAAEKSKTVKTPKGTCSACGDPVSRREYARCQSCALEASR
jgi:Holliday junction resolvase RusA-like endonuclease